LVGLEVDGYWSPSDIEGVSRPFYAVVKRLHPFRMRELNALSPTYFFYNLRCIEVLFIFVFIDFKTFIIIQ